MLRKPTPRLKLLRDLLFKKEAIGALTSAEFALKVGTQPDPGSAHFRMARTSRPAMQLSARHLLALYRWTPPFYRPRMQRQRLGG